MSIRQQIIAALAQDSRGGITTLADVAHAEQVIDAYRAEVITALAEEAERRLSVGKSHTVSKNAVLRFLRLEAATAREGAVNGEKISRLAADATPPGNVDVARRAHLLHEISKGGRWKSGDVVRWYERNGYAGLGVRAARHDLAVLRDSGALIQHDEKGVRYFTAARQGGHRA
ncbi:hypothetical protein ACH49_13480 [Streptomyces leeuwenhoekii]|uniref:DUF2087 domain-containing protein n=1 Tax=Streptomyces leeuwenhoekii TaxID=1437453 RepID=A0ABR5HZ72_STRLW|nr:hypothetical protein [Streptomyces leeuwenhoekii]KMS79067.1 hypothetical protein ACH49_13480 [Streptomyces leeuwenhoekii]